MAAESEVVDALVADIDGAAVWMLAVAVMSTDEDDEDEEDVAVADEDVEPVDRDETTPVDEAATADTCESDMEATLPLIGCCCCCVSSIAGFGSRVIRFVLLRLLPVALDVLLLMLMVFKQMSKCSERSCQLAT